MIEVGSEEAQRLLAVVSYRAVGKRQKGPVEAMGVDAGATVAGHKHPRAVGGGAPYDNALRLYAVVTGWASNRARDTGLLCSIDDGEEAVELDIVHGRALTPYAHHPQRLSVGVEFDPGGAPSPYRGGGAAAHHQVWVEVAKLVVEQLRLRGSHFDVRTEHQDDVRYNLAVIAKLVDYQDMKRLHAQDYSLDAEVLPHANRLTLTNLL